MGGDDSLHGINQKTNILSLKGDDYDIHQEPSSLNQSFTPKPTMKTPTISTATNSGQRCLIKKVEMVQMEDGDLLHGTFQKKKALIITPAPIAATLESINGGIIAAIVLIITSIIPAINAAIPAPIVPNLGGINWGMIPAIKVSIRATLRCTIMHHQQLGE